MKKRILSFSSIIKPSILMSGFADLDLIFFESHSLVSRPRILQSCWPKVMSWSFFVEVMILACLQMRQYSFSMEHKIKIVWQSWEKIVTWRTEYGINCLSNRHVKVSTYKKHMHGMQNWIWEYIKYLISLICTTGYMRENFRIYYIVCTILKWRRTIFYQNSQPLWWSNSWEGNI